MKLHLLLPRVEPDKGVTPTHCPYQGCDGKRLRWHQEVPKAIRDTKYEQVQVQRYQCLRMQTNLSGVSTRSESGPNLVDAGKGLAVMLYLLGLSYGATSLALEALGVSYCKSQVYYAVQEAASRVPGLKRDKVFARVAHSGHGSGSDQCARVVGNGFRWA